MSMPRQLLRVVYGSRSETMVPQLLHGFDLVDRIPANGLVVLKPNLVVARPSESGATTDPLLVEAVVIHLKSLGITNLAIMESSWLGEETEQAFSACGYRDLAERHAVPLIDLKQDRGRELQAGNLAIHVCEQVLGAAFLINMPVLKAHCQTKLTCALKNLKGCIPDHEKRRFHSLGLHEPIARLNMLIRSDLVIVDGIIGDLTFEEGGTPVRMNRLILGTDPVLVDAYAARLLGYDPTDIPYIGLAEDYGVGSADLKNARIFELNRDDAPKEEVVTQIGRAHEGSGRIDARQACSACYGSLLFALQRLEKDGCALPPGERIAIGQGFKGASGPGWGVGTCTAGLDKTIPGCPPAARDIVDFLASGKLRKGIPGGADDDEGDDGDDRAAPRNAFRGKSSCGI